MNQRRTNHSPAAKPRPSSSFVGLHKIIKSKSPEGGQHTRILLLILCPMYWTNRVLTLLVLLFLALNMTAWSTHIIHKPRHYCHCAKVLSGSVRVVHTLQCISTPALVTLLPLKYNVIVSSNKQIENIVSFHIIIMVEFLYYYFYHW